MRSSSVEKWIFEALSIELCHLTSQEILERVRKNRPSVNHSTVYRALERLAANGRISVSDMGTGSTVYELLTEKTHHHLVCQKCHAIQTIERDEINKFLAQICRDYHYSLVTNHLILFGICDNCQTSGTEQQKLKSN